MPRRSIPPKDKWTLNIFKAKAVKRGGIVRRNVSTVDEFGSFQLLKQEVKRRKFHMIRAGKQYVILCNAGDVKVLC